MTQTLLRIDASARNQGSISRELADKVAAKLAPETVITRDLNEALPHLDATWIGANFTPADTRDGAQKDALALSDSLVAELQAAETIVISLPIYNFGVPASLKSWVDLVARAGVTFRYTETGPVGLLSGKRAILIVASGGTEAEGPVDFATPYMKHVLGFIGITDVQIIAADRQSIDPEGSKAKANAAIEALAA